MAASKQIIITAGTPRLLFTRAQPVKYYVASFIGAAAPLLIPGFKLPENSPLAFPHDLAKFFRRCMRDVKNPTIHGERAGMLHLLEMLDFIAQHLRYAPPCEHRLASRAIEVIQTHWRSSAFGIAQLAQILDVDCKTLSTHFKASTGITPKQYLDHLRLQEAQNMLRQGQLPAEIAHAAGFNSSEYLAKFFKRKTGRPLSAYLADIASKHPIRIQRSG